MIKRKNKTQTQQSVKLSRFRYVLDWFSVDAVEVPISNGFEYEIQYRLGSWYLCTKEYRYDNQQWINRFDLDFRLDNPADAVIKLGDKVKKFSLLHDGNFTMHLSELLKRVAALRDAQEEAKP